eukprot:765542-Hanusia_phi.AAC.5
MEREKKTGPKGCNINKERNHRPRKCSKVKGAMRVETSEIKQSNVVVFDALYAWASLRFNMRARDEGAFGFGIVYKERASKSSSWSTSSTRRTANEHQEEKESEEENEEENGNE